MPDFPVNATIRATLVISVRSFVWFIAMALIIGVFLGVELANKTPSLPQ